MKNRKSYYNPFNLFEINIPVSKVSNFQASLNVFWYSKCKQISTFSILHISKCIFLFFLNDLGISNLNGNFYLKSDIQKICKMESYCSQFYFVFMQAVLYLDLWWFLRIRVWRNRWSRVKGGGVRRNNCEWAWAKQECWSVFLQCWKYLPSI